MSNLSKLEKIKGQLTPPDFDLQRLESFHRWSAAASMGTPLIPEKMMVLPDTVLCALYSKSGYRQEGILEVWTTLMSWLREQKVAPEDIQRLARCHDSPVFTPAEKCRYEAALSLPATLDIAIEPPFQKATLPGGRYAAFRFKGSPEQMEGFQTRLFTDWLPFSGFEPDAAPIIEFYDKPHPDTNDETTQLVLDVLVLLKVKSLKWG